MGSVRMFATVETFAQDVRHAFRLIRRAPEFSFTAVATLALGIGLNTAIFSVAHGVLWRPLPYPNPDRLVIVSSAQQTETGPRTFSTWPPLTYEGLRPRVTTLDHLAAYSSIDAQLTGRGEPLQLPALRVSPNFFATLGVNPARGRAFLTGAAAPDDDRAAIVSDRLWRTSLEADPAIVGQSITIDGLPRTVVGVLPPKFTFRLVIPRLGALPDADIFLPDRWAGDTGGNSSPPVPHRIQAELGAPLHVVRMRVTAPEIRLVDPLADGIPEDGLGVRADEAELKRVGIGFPDNGAERVDEAREV